MTGRLAGKVAVVTGGARGQGAATARLFALEGAKIVIADLLEDEGRALAAEIGSAALFIRLDVSSEESWGGLLDAVTAKFGAPDILVNNAGIVHAVGILELTRKDFERVLGINLIGAWLGIKSLAPGMIAKRMGAIINIASSSGLWGMNGLTPYSASKWGVRSLTKTAALELGHKGIRVNAIFPGGINTKMGNITNEDVTALNKHYQRQPIQRIGEPEEVARTSLFLASEDASYLCGAEIAVDGGQTLGVYTDFLPGGPG